MCTHPALPATPALVRKKARKKSRLRRYTGPLLFEHTLTWAWAGTAALLCRRHGVEPADLVLKWAAHHHNSKMARFDRDTSPLFLSCRGSDLALGGSRDELPTKAALAELGKKLERSEKVRKTQVQHAVADDRTFDASSAGVGFFPLSLPVQSTLPVCWSSFPLSPFSCGSRER